MFNVLLIDDSKVIHSYVTECLQGSDVQLSHAMNGKEGKDNVLSGKVSYDLILLDWEMPVLTGPETLDALKNAGVKTPIIMMTSKNAPEEIVSMLEKGAAEYCMKPFTREILLEKIELVTGKVVNPHATAA